MPAPHNKDLTELRTIKHYLNRISSMSSVSLDIPSFLPPYTSHVIPHTFVLSNGFLLLSGVNLFCCFKEIEFLSVDFTVVHDPTPVFSYHPINSLHLLISEIRRQYRNIWVRTG